MSILDSLKDAVTGAVSDNVEEKIEGMAAPLAEKMPEGVVDSAEDMINKATGMDLDLNGNEAPAESAEPVAAGE
jgi:hypothetical protein